MIQRPVQYTQQPPHRNCCSQYQEHWFSELVQHGSSISENYLKAKGNRNSEFGIRKTEFGNRKPKQDHTTGKRKNETEQLVSVSSLKLVYIK